MYLKDFFNKDIQKILCWNIIIIYKNKQIFNGNINKKNIHTFFMKKEIQSLDIANTVLKIYLKEDDTNGKK
ncbi:hypothetical protein [Clostridium perfringens]|uniref:Uncharacterized protein n=1 Tax=Clostridium perfringens TaxID=1502 RepID=A0A8H9QYK2_CLOPF|nr:hypothetical protein [Clostridium perfringens]MDU7977654.1 hypothetical protein [Clostridioides difficile]EGS5729620.1 hypothetical protein [Clostridium perfringens]EGT0014772.1 hypothetical protein [Clostridium perfringens]MBI6024492.1 hypothetical protein [Clostridium perfringens]MBI6048521.1 hypothetical protein [Clostridium perfringens]